MVFLLPRSCRESTRSAQCLAEPFHTARLFWAVLQSPARPAEWGSAGSWGAYSGGAAHPCQKNRAGTEQGNKREISWPQYKTCPRAKIRWTQGNRARGYQCHSLVGSKRRESKGEPWGVGLSSTDLMGEMHRNREGTENTRACLHVIDAHKTTSPPFCSSAPRFWLQAGGPAESRASTQPAAAPGGGLEKRRARQAVGAGRRGDYFGAGVCLLYCFTSDISTSTSLCRWAPFSNCSWAVSQSSIVPSSSYLFFRNCYWSVFNSRQCASCKWGLQCTHFQLFLKCQITKTLHDSQAWHIRMLSARKPNWISVSVLHAA